jgi:FecR protein
MSTPQSRRTTLKQLAALGLLGPAGISGLIQEAFARGDLPTASGVNSVSGSLSINGQAAKTGSMVKPGDRVTTAKDSSAVVVVGRDAYLLRDSTNVVFEASQDTPGALASVLITTGKVLAVFEKRKEKGISVKVPNAVIGIRGTGAYFQAEAERSYFCLCYGEAAIDGKGMASAKIIKTLHHENPVWLDDRGGIMKVENAALIAHTDEELIMLEKLFGRVPPFVERGLTGRY